MPRPDVVPGGVVGSADVVGSTDDVFSVIIQMEQFKM